MYRRLDAVTIDLEALGLRHLAQQEIGLRQLAETRDIDALRTFASVLEPVSFSDRYHQQKTSQLTALDRLVDALRPDAPSGREFRQLTQAFLKNPRSDTPDRQRLLARLNQISAALPQVQKQISVAPRLAEVAPRATELAALTKAASEAVEYLSTGTRAPAGWKSASAASLTAAGQPSAIVRFTMLDSFAQLFAAVQEGS